jgi:hypothetical protein
VRMQCAGAGQEVVVIMAGGVGLYVLVPNSDLHQKYP